MTSQRKRKSVLIVTETVDTSADLVVQALKKRDAQVFRCDTSEFPQSLTMSAQFVKDAWVGRFSNEIRSIELSDISGIFYRRPSPFRLSSGMSGPERRFAHEEARAAFGGLLGSLEAVWLNHPARSAEASFKLRQLQVWAESGLRVPGTIVTNDPEDVRRFSGEVNGPLIGKSLGFGVINENGENGFIYTRKITDEDLSTLRGVNETAHLFQEWIPKRHEVRTTVVGEKIFSAAIYASSPSAKIDWRSDYDSLEYRLIDTPDSIRAAVVRYLKSYNLIYGAFDFVVTPEDEWVFLECNPSGQWGWIESETGAPIAETIADALIAIRR